MLPQEIKELPSDDELIFLEGCKPIRCQKNWFFKDKQLKQWASMPPVAINVAMGPDASAASPDVMQALNEQEREWLH